MKKSAEKQLFANCYINYKELESLAEALFKSGHSASLNPLNYPLVNNHLQMSSSPTGFADNQSHIFLSQTSTFCFFLLTVLTNKLEGLPECFDLLDLLDFQVSKICHSFLNDMYHSALLLIYAGHASPETRNFAKGTGITALSSRS